MLTASDGFQFIGTMNPGGDYGKKELSPALRNRMTEIWCVPPDEKDELATIITNALSHLPDNIARAFFDGIWEFISVLRADPMVGTQVVFSVRDALAYADYIKERDGFG